MRNELEERGDCVLKIKEVGLFQIQIDFFWTNLRQVLPLLKARCFSELTLFSDQYNLEYFIIAKTYTIRQFPVKIEIAKI
jgi:hypothetical protein